MPVPLDADHPTLVQIRHRSGDHLGTIVVSVDGHAWEAPVAFGAYRVIADYRQLAAAALRSACPEGALVRVRASGCCCGADGVLPVVEVVISADGGSLGEALVRRGWAVPDPQALLHHRSADGYWQALREARSLHAGIWGESGADALTLGIPERQERATAPQRHPPPLWDAAGMVVLLAALVLVAMRRAQAVAAPAPATAQRRGGLHGACLRLGGYGLRLVCGTLPRRRP